MNQQIPAWKVLLLGVAAWLIFAGPKGCDLKLPLPVPSPTLKATAATYVYEKDKTAIPAAVEAALDKLNRDRKILATKFEEDTIDGTGQTPAQYKVALAAAKEAGLPDVPSLVVQAGDRVLNVVKNPKTEEEVLGAVP